MITIYAIIDFDIFIDVKSNLAQKDIRNSFNIEGIHENWK